MNYEIVKIKKDDVEKLKALISMSGNNITLDEVTDYMLKAEFRRAFEEPRINLNPSEETMRGALETVIGIPIEEAVKMLRGTKEDKPCVEGACSPTPMKARKRKTARWDNKEGKLAEGSGLGTPIGSRLVDDIKKSKGKVSWDPKTGSVQPIGVVNGVINYPKNLSLGLTTLSDVYKLKNGTTVGHTSEGKMTTGPSSFVHVNHDTNTISFDFNKLRARPSFISGTKAIRLDHPEANLLKSMTEISLIMIQGLNSTIPCRQNGLAITKLEEAIHWLKRHSRGFMPRYDVDAVEEHIERIVDGSDYDPRCKALMKNYITFNEGVLTMKIQSAPGTQNGIQVIHMISFCIILMRKLYECDMSIYYHVFGRLMDAYLWIEDRTDDRLQRGVEGTLQK